MVAAVIDDNIVPRPLEVFARVIDIVASGEAASNFATTLAKIGAGFALAVAAGLPLGFLMGRSAFMNSYLSLPMFVLGNVPGLTYAVFGLVIFGVGPGGPIVVSALVAVPFIAINVAEGVRSVDGDLLRMCQAFERPPRDVLRHVYLPAVSAFVLVGVRYGFAMAWKVEALDRGLRRPERRRVHDPQGLPGVSGRRHARLDNAFRHRDDPDRARPRRTSSTACSRGERNWHDSHRSGRRGGRPARLAAARQGSAVLGGRVDGVGADHAGRLAARRRASVTASRRWRTPSVGSARRGADGQLWTNLAVSMNRFVLGLVAALLVGAALGVAMGLSRIADYALTDLTMAGLAIPAVIWALLTTMWFGFGWLTPVTTVFLCGLPFVIVNIAKAVRADPRGDHADGPRVRGGPHRGAPATSSRRRWPVPRSPRCASRS